MKNIVRRDGVVNNLPNNFHPVLKRVLANRGVKEASELDYSLKNLLLYSTLSGIDKAVNLLYTAMVKQDRILIVADFDADGATSCTLAINALKKMGAKKVGFVVPNRKEHGYGLRPEIVELIDKLPLMTTTEAGTGSDLLVTVDNGISSHTGVEAAKQRGMKVIITDHHEPGYKLPAADAIVNPKQPGDNFPSKNLCGVGVIFYVMLALRVHLRDNNWFKDIPEPNLAEYLDLVALGTVADVVSLDYNNRILVEQGLRRIQANNCCSGIRALIQEAQRDQANLVASDLAFYLGPRLNAAGRMDDMSYGIACLLCEDDLIAKQHTKLLQIFNQERRVEEAKMNQEAIDMLDIDKVDSFGLCLLDENWHQGVTGILASRIKDRLHRPVIIFTHGTNTTIRGSGRSVSGVNIRDVIDTIATKNPNMVIHFGGHAMAAGLTIQRDQFVTFQQAFDQEISKFLSSNELHGVIFSDGELTTNDFNLNLAEKLRKLTPWGHDFPEPIFDGEFELVDHKILKERHLKMQVRPIGGGQIIDAIAFNTGNIELNTTQVRLAYRLDINIFRGKKRLQLMVEYVES
ncbi:single-stranded-DNA-specific exonuclease RecJ [Thiotrichales bacterium HSG1]|nr:single-stranded-DNA-specific exonuclease RecJ [Thiotrichales bacterium HSG1]